MSTSFYTGAPQPELDPDQPWGELKLTGTLQLQGPPGKPGEQGIPGTPGEPGLPGLDGRDGANGKSAYESAVSLGFVGTELEWVASLKGRDGTNGRDGVDGLDGDDGIDGAPGAPGTPGRDGINGKDGLNGTNGRDGKDGAPGAPGRDGIDGAPGLPGRDGIDGVNGRDGKDGEPGPQGEQGVPGDGFDPSALDGKQDKSEVLTNWNDAAPNVAYQPEGYSLFPVIAKDDLGIFGGTYPISGKGVELFGQATPASMRQVLGITGTGADGAQGIQGIQGVPGKDGKDGAAGAKGDPGIQGIQGIQGVPGKDGANAPIPYAQSAVAWPFSLTFPTASAYQSLSFPAANRVTMYGTPETVGATGITSGVNLLYDCELDVLMSVSTAATVYVQVSAYTNQGGALLATFYGQGGISAGTQGNIRIGLLRTISGAAGYITVRIASSSVQTNPATVVIKINRVA